MCLSRFLALLFFIAFPLYIAIRGPASLSDIAFLLSSLSERAEALHIELTSPLAAPSAPISTEVFKTSTEPTKPTKPVRAPESGRRKRYPSLIDGLAHCINSFEQYSFLAEKVLQRKHARYSKQTPAQKAISNNLGYPAHFEKARKGIEVNARFSEKIAQIAREDYHTGAQALEDHEEAEFGVVDLAFGHLSRDWSTQGAKERQAVFPPVLGGLEQHFGGNGRGNKVLVPGSGMGRLASDLADLGASILLHWVEGAASHWRRVRRHGQ
jgi:carnosine N-methyltransferase